MTEHVVELEIGGMTCASCATRIEKKLNRMDGVVATVNYATEKAQVTLRRRPSGPTTWSPPSRRPATPPRCRRRRRHGDRGDSDGETDADRDPSPSRCGSASS